MIKIKLDENFSELGLCSWISYETLKDILTMEEIKLNMKNPQRMSYKITGFIINKKGIKIQKEYIKKPNLKN